MIDITVSENIPPDQYLLPNEMMVSGSYPGCFFDFDAKDPRPLMNMALSVSENLLKGIPEGSEVLVMDVPSSNVSGGTLFIDVDYDDEIVVSVSHPKYNRVPEIKIPCKYSAKNSNKPVMKVAKELADVRGRNYPEVGEQLDAMWKIINALVAGQVIPEDAKSVQQAILNVKTSIPKRSK